MRAVGVLGNQAQALFTEEETEAQKGKVVYLEQPELVVRPEPQPWPPVGEGFFPLDPYLPYHVLPA